MKKKLLLLTVLVIALTCIFAISVSAAGVHDNVDKTQKVTLSDGTQVNLFDSEGNALIWYKDASGTLQSIRADDSRVKFKATYGFDVGNNTVGKKYVYEVSDMWIQLDETTKIAKTNVVVFNLMDDDVLVNEATNNSYLNNPVNCVKTVQWANTNLEYAYLRLDTAAIQQQAFAGCTKLKYINLENLTELRQIGGSQTFSGCSILFAGQVLDLTKTKLVSLAGEGAFNGVPFIDVKFPDSLTNINSWCLQGTGLVNYVFPKNVTKILGSQFKNCASLKTIVLHNNLVSISDSAFKPENKSIPLEKIFFVGTLEQLNTLLDNTSTGNNAPFWNVVGENRSNLISYEDYLKLEDKSGNYVVYGYSYCEAYNGGKHEIGAEGEYLFLEEKFTSAYVKISMCAHEDCNVNETSTICNPLVTDKGYAKQENGSLFTYGIVYNKAEIAKYVALQEEGYVFSYGIVVGNGTLDANLIANDGTAIEGAIALDLTETENNYTVYNLKLTGVDDDQKDLAVYACAYIIDGGVVSYVGNGVASEAKTVTYNSIETTIKEQ